MSFSFLWAIRLLSVPSSLNKSYEDGTDRVFQKVGTQNSDAGESPKDRIQQFVICVVHLLVNVIFRIRHEMNNIRSVLKVLRKILGLKREGATEH